MSTVTKPCGQSQLVTANKSAQRTPGSKRLFTYDDEFTLYEVDARSLQGHSWLTDNVINFAVAFLKTNLIKTDELKQKICIIYATYCEMIKYVGEDEKERKDLFEGFGMHPDKWSIFLFNDNANPQRAYGGSHWLLIVFEPINKRFLLYDPIKQSGASIQVHIKQFVQKMVDFYGVTAEHPVSRMSNIPGMSQSGDCGMYLVEYVQAILESLKKNINACPRTDFDFSAINDRFIWEQRRDWLGLITNLALKHEQKESETKRRSQSQGKQSSSQV